MDLSDPLAMLHPRPCHKLMLMSNIAWSLLLSVYMCSYTMPFRKNLQHQNIDALSRFPLPQIQTESRTTPKLVLLMDHLDESSVTAPTSKSEQGGTPFHVKFCSVWNGDGQPTVTIKALLTYSTPSGDTVRMPYLRQGHQELCSYSTVNSSKQLLPWLHFNHGNGSQDHG